MAKDKPFKKGPETEFIEKLFGDVANLSDEELDLLFESCAPGTNAAQAAHVVAERVATRYRQQNKVPPKHVLECLKTTAAPTLEGAKSSKLKQIIDSLKAPFTAPVWDPAAAYRNRKEQSERDKDGVKELDDELGEDWEEQE
jgi:hypothetical protein